MKLDGKVAVITGGASGIGSVDIGVNCAVLNTIGAVVARVTQA